MKILLVTGIFPPDIGGPATYVPKIAASLTERGHGVKNCHFTVSISSGLIARAIAGDRQGMSII